MISVEDAGGRILGRMHPLAAETVSLSDACGRVLAADVVSRRTQPWADVSAMDGYAVHGADVATVPATFKQVGYVPAGTAHDTPVDRGECVRIFTGAPLPPSTDTVVIQEDVEAAGDTITVHGVTAAGRHVRTAGLDFAAGETLLHRGRRLTVRDVALCAAMNVPWLSVRRRPRVAILQTGNEIVLPGDPVGANQIVSANGFGLAALVRACGGVPILLGIARDDAGSLEALAAGAAGCDLLITTGGASVGEHDLVQQVLGAHGLTLDFWKIAMRPGKPLMFGQIHGVPMLGLPGNPVSNLVCALLFVRPALQALQGLAAEIGPNGTARLARDLPANGPREDYMRARWVERSADGPLAVDPAAIQDSSMMTRLAQADCLVVRPPHAPAAKAGTEVDILTFPEGPFPI